MVVKLRQSLKLPNIHFENIVVTTFGNSKAMVKNIDIVPVQFNCGEKTMIECISTPFLCLVLRSKISKSLRKIILT